MKKTRSTPPIAECRHMPVGSKTPLTDHFRYWFIFADHSFLSFSYTVGMPKCAKCGKRIRIPDFYYSLPFNLLYLVCFTIIAWGEIALLNTFALSKDFLLLFCVIVLLLLTYLLVDRVVWFVLMHICRWRAVAIDQVEHKTFLQRESKRFTDDRLIKRIMWLLGIGLGCCLAGTPPKWDIYHLGGLGVGLLIRVFMRK